MTDWSRQFETLHQIISFRLLGNARKATLKNVAMFLGQPEYKIQAWKGGQCPVFNDCVMLAKEHGFNPEWILLGTGNPLTEEGEKIQADFQILNSRFWFSNFLEDNFPDETEQKFFMTWLMEGFTAWRKSKKLSDTE